MVRTVKHELVAGLLGISLALARGLAADAPARPGDWEPIHVPGATNFTGTAWYRAWVKVPDSYFTKHERNLFEESVGIYIRDLAGAHDVWVNGKRIGTGGAFPPGYQSGR